MGTPEARNDGLTGPGPVKEPWGHLQQPAPYAVEQRPFPPTNPFSSVFSPQVLEVTDATSSSLRGRSAGGVGNRDISTGTGY